MITLYRDRQGKIHQKPKNVKAGFRPSAYAFILNHKKEVLMVVPAWNKLWELPGGGIEPEESIKEAVLRECLEETGYKCKLISEQPIHVLENNFFLEAEKKYLRALILIYRAEIISQKQDLTKVNTFEELEIKKIGWVPLKNLNSKNCHHIYWPLIRQMKKNK